MRLTINIEMDNAAFENDATRELKATLIQLIGKIERGAFGSSDSIKLMDVNGNTIGRAEVTE